MKQNYRDRGKYSVLPSSSSLLRWLYWPEMRANGQPWRQELVLGCPYQWQGYQSMQYNLLLSQADLHDTVLEVEKLEKQELELIEFANSADCPLIIDAPKLAPNCRHF